MTSDEFVAFVSSPDRLVRQLRAAGVIARELAPFGLHPVVVGGSAVEFYTRGSYATVDVALVVDGVGEIDRALRGLGFTRLAGASYVHAQADVVIDLPREPLDGDATRIVTVDVEGLTVYVIGIEDIIADRLRAAVHWDDLSSKEWAIQLMAAQWEAIDWAYLQDLSKAEPPALGVVLRECRQVAESVVRGDFPSDGG